jgi:hypothetical protein
LNSTDYRISDFKVAEKRQLLLFLDDIRSLHNIGSVLELPILLIEKEFIYTLPQFHKIKEIHKNNAEQQTRFLGNIKFSLQKPCPN